MTTDVIAQALDLFSIIGVLVFAMSGALVAAQKNMDIVGFVLIGTVTGIGGGTLRDLLLGVSPVMWVQDPLSVYLCVVAAVLTYVLVSFRREVKRSWVLWLDAVGLAAFTVLGVQAALSHQVLPVIAITMGMMTATFGGILRDVLCADALTLMSKELYITCSLMGALVYVVLDQLAVAGNVAAACSFVTAFGLRAAAIHFQLAFPDFSERE